MERDGWQRGAALGGAVFVVVNTALGLAGAEPPPMSSSASDAAAHFAAHAGAMKAGLWLFGVAAVGLLWWFGALYQWMTRTERSVGLTTIGALSAVGFLLAAVASSLSTSATADVTGLVAAAFFSVWVLGVSHRLCQWDTTTDATRPASSLVA